MEDIIIETQDISFGNVTCTIDFSEILPSIEPCDEYIDSEEWYAEIAAELTDEDS